jgi:hypothetical protein
MDHKAFRCQFARGRSGKDTTNYLSAPITSRRKEKERCGPNVLLLVCESVQKIEVLPTHTYLRPEKFETNQVEYVDTIVYYYHPFTLLYHN